jgi:hypothetical protein
LRGAAEMRADYSNSFNAPLQSASSSTSSIAARVKVYARRGAARSGLGSEEVRARRERVAHRSQTESDFASFPPAHGEQINFAVLHAGPRDSRYSESMPPLLFFLV